MRPIAPDAGDEVIVAQEQLEYYELPAAKVVIDGSHGLLTRWRLTTQEQAMVYRGSDLYLSILTFGQPLQPIQLTVGCPEHLSAQAMYHDLQESLDALRKMRQAVLGKVVDLAYALYVTDVHMMLGTAGAREGSRPLSREQFHQMPEQLTLYQHRAKLVLAAVAATEP